MEQLLGTFGIDWKLLLAQAVNFGLLLVFLTYFLYKPVLKALEERKVLVAKGVEDARHAEVAAERADAHALHTRREAQAEAESIVARARQEGGSEKQRLLEEAQARAEGMEREASMRAQESKAQALRESEKEIARLAILAAEKAMQLSAH